MPDGASLLTQGTRREEAVRALADYSDEDDKATLEILGHPFRDGLCEEKMTQGWVVYGGMRHAEPQREMFPRSYCANRSRW
jgi:hypothetical protein